MTRPAESILKVLRRAVRLPVALAAMLAVGATGFAQMPSENQANLSVDRPAKAEVIRALCEDLQTYYVFPDVGRRVVEMLQARLKRGEYDQVTSAEEFSRLLTSQMGELTHDAHLRVLYSARPLPPMPPPPEEADAPPPLSPEMVRRMKQENFAFQRVERLAGNVGYLQLTRFTDATLGGATLAGAMGFLANTDALIIDLRHNMGGGPDMVALLAAYFLPGETHLNDIEWRKKGTGQYTLHQSWTPAYVPGNRYLDKEVYILAGPETRSAAEEFTYDLQTLKRAVVVGESTWGGANPGMSHGLGDHFMVFVPAGHAINPITRTNWEGSGIEPNVKAPQQEARATAYRLALQHLTQNATDEREKAALQEALANVRADTDK